jgi:UDP-N-acetylglucosamine diphosphorylase/glucosamine-1-phosphate N-acetyltransferase
MKIIILAGGEGKRMNSSLPKVLHLYKGVPMIIRILQASMGINPEKILLVVGKYKQQIKETVESYFSSANIIYVNQTEPKGTGDAVLSCFPYFESSSDVLILNGDMPLVTSELLAEIVKTPNSIAIANVEKETATGYGRIIYDKDGKIVCIREEKDCSPEEKKITLVNAGIYYFSEILLKKCVEQIKPNKITGEYYLTDIIAMCDVHPYVVQNTTLVKGINTQEELEMAHKIQN